MSFPLTRLRRLRYNKSIRKLVEDITLTSKDLIYPIFVCEGKNIKKEINSLPGQHQLSIDNVLKICKELISKNIKSIILFGIPSKKNHDGSIACEDDSIIQKTIKEIKIKFKDLLVIVDLCNCEYTTHGHCGTIIDNDVDNDLTLETLGKQAVSLAKAGADVIAPSDMMDGRVKFIRNALDNDGYYKIPIFSYSIKYASSFYGPLREAVNSNPMSGARKTYQMNFKNSNEAIREVDLDIKEGSDVIIIKPALCYLDIIQKIKKKFNIPIIAYNVSGEYSMVKSGGSKNWIDETAIILEILFSMKRAGANAIITYHALEIVDYLKK